MVTRSQLNCVAPQLSPEGSATMRASHFLGFLLLATAATGASASASACVNVTLSNIFKIGECLGNQLDYCSSMFPSTGMVTGTAKVLRCFLTGLYANASPQGTVAALGPLLQIIANRALGGATLPGNFSLSAGVNFFNTNSTCGAPITIRLPGAAPLTSCVGDAAMVCTAGSPTTTSAVTYVVNNIACMLNSLNLLQLTTVVAGVACQLQTGLKSVAANSGDLATVVNGILGVLQPLFLTCNTSG
ncbi:uncharacterized protein LOC144168970 [Haemaphysalis longicornis]